MLRPKAYTLVGVFRTHRSCLHVSWNSTKELQCRKQRIVHQRHVSNSVQKAHNPLFDFLKVSSCHGNVSPSLSEYGRHHCHFGRCHNMYFQCVRSFAAKSRGRGDVKSYVDVVDYDSSKEYSDDELRSDEESDDEGDTSGEPKSWKDVVHSVSGFRADQMLAVGLGISRKQVEVAFLSGKLRFNGEKLTKKSKRVELNDALDLIKSRQGSEEGTMNVMRVVLKKINDEKTNKGNHVVSLRRWKHLSIPKPDKK
ncbi:uncharacterized protein LOC144433406 [Glandiceps talaboti]